MQINLSFILPCFNVAEYLPDALHTLTLLPQDEIEVIIVNDGSTDNTLEVAQSYIGRIKNLIIIDQKNQQVSASRNNGLRVASGNYIHFLDPDDIIRLDEFLIIYEESKKNICNILIGNGNYYEDNQITKPISPDQMRITLGITTGPEYYHFANINKEYVQFCWLLLLKREFLITNEILFTEGIKHEDKEYAAKCFARAKTVKYIPTHFLLYRQRSTSISNEPNRYYSPESIESYRRVISNLSNWYERSHDKGERSVLNRAIAECFATIYRRIPSMKKHQVPEVRNYTWGYINESGAFEFLTYKNKLLVLEKRFKAFIR